MKRLMTIVVIGGVVGWLALPARANFDAKATLSCTSAVGEKLVKAKVVNEDIVAACLGVLDTEDPLVALHALVFDSDTDELRVIQRCDGTVVCDLSDVETCADAVRGTPGNSRTRSVCILELSDAGFLDVDGTLICRQSETETASTFRFKASCSGILSTDDIPCTVKLKTGRLFEEGGSCPP